jgi:two-component system sensor histidine kinase KdpD
MIRPLDPQVPEQQLSQERLKVFLGYASGVGKSFRMFDEGRRRRERAQDVVVGAVQPNLSPEIERLIQTLQVIPLKKIGAGEAVDVEALLARRPQVCLIDGAAYDNPPGSRNAKRWQDIMELVSRQIVVITSLNLQHIEERRDVVKQITGHETAVTVPLSFLYEANEIVIVDVPPELLLERAGGSEAALAETQRQLSALREQALLLTAEVVDRQLEDYLHAHGIELLWGTQERILVCLTPGSNAEAMLASARRNAERFHGEWVAVYVRHSLLSHKEERELQPYLAAAHEQGAHIEVLDGDDPVEALMDFARAHRVTQIFVGPRRRRHWWNSVTGGPIDRLIRAAEGMDVRVFPP